MNKMVVVTSIEIFKLGVGLGLGGEITNYILDIGSLMCLWDIQMEKSRSSR